MDSVAHFDDIYAAGDELMFDGFDPENIGVIEVTGSGRSKPGNVVVNASHRRLNDGSNEGSLGFGYEGVLYEAEYSLETVLNAGNSTEVSGNLTAPLGFKGNSFNLSAELSHEGDNDTYSFEWQKEPVESDNGFSMSLKASKESEPTSGVMVTPAVSYSWQGMRAGVKLLFDGGVGKLAGSAYAMSQTVQNLSLAFLYLRGDQNNSESETKFTCNAVFDASEKCRLGAAYTKPQGSSSVISIASQYTLDENLQLKSRIDTTGLFAIACTLLISAKLSITMFLQQQRGVELSARGGLTISYNGDEEEQNGGEEVDE
eukprot:TRINITY_DN9742_c0_g2_i1.p1 TRINITY_DN9742_c0_g2~~TRINITY_DN9742_c0_g2_i1.p1  ORF type:complete len:315 (+),score=49.08 TRINITY_DN9742_c0_g2_i1:341-1285(+)